ncbi:MAG TPA: tetratricopeptide repeat protein [Polyangiaceae bacterium]|nr:tetratricopeptide repeat protein [Polyangiaceae bacterium]
MMWRCVTIAALLLTPRLAAAQAETKAAVADALYRQARDLMAAGKYDEACPKLAQSQQLDPATGTLLNLAACHEKQGKLATAWLEYSDALVAARRDGREDRVQYARERAAELEPKLSRLTLLLAPNADAPGLAIELDGTSVGNAVFGVPTPVDPGKHSVRASAPGKKPQIFSIEVAVAEQQSLSIPPLEDAPVEAPPVEPTRAGRSDGATNPEQPRSDELQHRPIPTSVYLSGGITLALAASASVTGVAYLNKRSDYEALAKSEGLTGAVEDRRDTAQRYGYANLGLWIGAAIGAGVTTYLYVTRPTQQSAIRVSPWLGPQLAGLGVGGGF